jgi:hypothetical protein
VAGPERANSLAACADRIARINEYVISVSSHKAREKVLAFFGSDLRRHTAREFLQRASSQGYELLTLDSSAMLLCREAETPYRLMEDFVEPEALYEAHLEANDCGLHWFEAGRDAFTIDGGCWPELDCGALRHFWSNVTLAVKLAEAIKKARIAEFRFFRHFSPLPQIGGVKSDACQVLWEAELPGIARPFITFQHLSASRLVQSIKKIPKKFFPRNKLRERQEHGGISSFPEAGIVIVMAAAEAFRFADLVTRISARFPGKVGVVTVKSHPAVADSVAWKQTVPLRYGPVVAVESWMPRSVVRLRSRSWRGLAERFFSGYFECVAHSAGTPWEKPLRSLRYQFEHYCLYRWPMLQTTTRDFWTRLWSQYRPEMVLVSSVADASFRLAAFEARRAHILSVGIPHGGVIGPPGHCIPALTDVMLYSAASQKDAFESRGLLSSALTPCRNLVADNEYRVDKACAFRSQEKLRVLALTDTTDEGTNLAKLVGFQAQRNALRTLAEPPRDLANLVDVRLKVHPSFSDLPMIAAASPELMARVVPADADLHEVLKETDLVVAVNYYGSALIHALRAGKPVLYLLTVQESLAESRLNLFWLFRDATEVARTSTAFWNTIRTFMANQEFAQGMRNKAQEFSLSRLDDTNFPEITELTESMFRRLQDCLPSP